MNLICFDPHTGIMRRYSRGVSWHGIQPKPCCTGEAKMKPWDSLAPHERVVSRLDLEAFRLNRATGVPLAPEAA